MHWQQEAQRAAIASAVQQHQDQLFRLAAAAKLKDQDEDSAAVAASASSEEEKPVDVITNDDDIAEEDDENLKKPSAEEVKRELEMVEDEMKESDEDSKADLVKKEEVKAQEEDVTAESLKRQRLAMMKKLLEINGGMSAEGKAAAASVMELFMKQQQQQQEGDSEETSKETDPVAEGDWNQSGAYEDSINSNDGDSQDGVSPASSALNGGSSTLAGGVNGSGSGLGGNAVHLGSEDRKVRVRTLISEEQLAVLKGYYMLNPRPKREELDKIASKIGHPFKVVKVWFQNSRARDRREGKPVTTQPGQPTAPATGPLSSLFPQMVNGGDTPLTSAAGAQQPPAATPFLNNNFPQSPSQLMAAAAAASGLFPRLPGLPPLVGAASRQQQKSDSSGNEDAASKDDNMSECNGDQPLDLSGKGSSPSMSPLSNPGSQRSPTPHLPPLPLPLPTSSAALPLSPQLDQFRAAAAAAAAASVAGGSPKFPFPLPGLRQAPTPAAFPGSAGFPGLDLYRFTDERTSPGGIGADEEGHFPCTKCDKVFNKKSSLARHNFEHSGKEENNCP